MINLFSSVTNLCDLHCHIIPYVDDGVDDYEDARNMIIEEYSQGVRLIVMTPHLRLGMFDTSVSIVQRHFAELQNWHNETDMYDLKLYISREYYCDERLEVLLDAYAEEKEEVSYKGQNYLPKNEIIPFGEHNCILLEFSSNRLQSEEFERFIRKASNAGFTPIIAHVERYPAVQKNPSITLKMKDLGAYLQVNCENILLRNKNIESNTADILIKQEIADIAASDSHNLYSRLPNLKKSYNILKRIYGKNTADKLLIKNPQLLVYDS